MQSMSRKERAMERKPLVGAEHVELQTFKTYDTDDSPPISLDS